MNTTPQGIPLHTFDLEPIEPIDHQGVMFDQAELELEQPAEPEPERPTAGRAAGYPLAKMFVSVNVVISARMFPGAPLSPEERRELEAAAAEVEAYYAPDLSGPWWLWARLATCMGMVYGPRVAERRAERRELEAAAAPEVSAATVEVPHAE